MSRQVILLVEDDEPKQRSVMAFLRETVRDSIEIVSAESLASAVAALSSFQVALAVVDMSIPTFDFVKDRRGGGQPQGFGGADVLRFIDSETHSTRSVVLTQYEEFTLAKDSKPRDPRGLEDLLREELDRRFLGVIHYTGQHGPWRAALRTVLNDLQLIASAP